MHTRSILIAASLAAAVILAGAAAHAQAPAPPSPAAATLQAPLLGAGAPRMGRGGRAARLAAAVRHDPALAVVINLRAIERVYREQGKASELPAFYGEQLGKTDDPVVRNFVHYRLARLEMRDNDAAAALQSLRRNLDENYRRL